MSDYKTHFADEQTLAYIAKLEAELSEWKLRALTVESSEEDAQQAAVRFKAERDKLAYMIEYIESLDPVIVEWALAGFQQEAKP